MAAKGQLDVVATQDWDALLYGSPVLVRNLMDDGAKRYGRVVHAQSIDLGEMLASNELTREQLVDLAIMIGTDYHPGHQGHWTQDRPQTHQKTRHARSGLRSQGKGRARAAG